jgi:GNAT superfamily N-acetyltransferase
MRVLLYADGDRATGAGHQVRSAALARALQADGHEIELLERTAVGSTSNWAWQGLPQRALEVSQVDAALIASETNAVHADVVVVDSYAIGPVSVPCPVVRFADLPGTMPAADLVIDGAGCPADHPGLVTACGPAWIPLRPEFSSVEPAVHRAGTVIAIGGTDPLVLGAEIAARLPPVTTRIPGGWTATAVADAFRGAARAVVTASSVAWEALACGTPIVAVVTARNQEPTAARLRELGVSVTGPDPGAIVAAWEKLATAVPSRVDGQGARRLARRLAELPWRSAHLRPAVWADSRRLLTIANLPDVRAVSFRPEPITETVHAAWVAQRLMDPDARIWLTPGGEGTIRLQRDADVAVVSLALDPAARGRGLAGTLVADIQGWLRATGFAARLEAWVRHGNQASNRLFARAGFTPARETVDATLFTWSP